MPRPPYSVGTVRPTNPAVASRAEKSGSHFASQQSTAGCHPNSARSAIRKPTDRRPQPAKLGVVGAQRIEFAHWPRESSNPSRQEELSCRSCGGVLPRVRVPVSNGLHFHPPQSLGASIATWKVVAKDLPLRIVVQDALSDPPSGSKSMEATGY
jgi:hypothetical protein